MDIFLDIDADDLEDKNEKQSEYDVNDEDFINNEITEELVNNCDESNEKEKNQLFFDEFYEKQIPARKKKVLISKLLNLITI